jgi:uncharacterized protein YbaP (TraB family)
MTKKTNWLLTAAATCLQLLFSQFSFSQKLPSTLLWKISGNGLEKPSYLYGTMHLTDERIFNLGDSLYKAIEHSDGFAIEIDPEQFTPFVIDKTKKEIYQNSIPLEKTMDRDNFAKYGPMLAKRLHKNIGEVTTADVLREKNKWIEESFNTGKMQTFLDAYLFDIARREGKWTGGVEDLKDQEGAVDMIDESDIEQLAMSSDDNEMKKENDLSAEYLINAYIKNDLDAIEAFTNQGDSAFQDAVLFKRNKKMAMRMDSLAHQRSMVFAVGAAHLPGSKGLIAALKEKGFTVTPVFSSKKIKPADYMVAEVPLQWYDVKDPDGLYTASMPGKPGDITIYGVMNMKMYFDVFSCAIYMAAAIKTPYTQKMADSIFSTMADYYFGVPNYSQGKPVTINNIPGREFVSKKENFSHGYLLFKNGTMYIALGVSTKKGNSNKNTIDRFLHSLTLFESVKAADKSLTYINKIKAYQVAIPAPAKSGEEYLAAVTKDSSIRQELNISSDPETRAYLLFGTNEASPGYTLENDSLILVKIGESQKSKFKKIDVDTMYIKNGLRNLDISGIMMQAPLILKIRYQIRGNRWYGLVAIYDTSKDITSVQKFFNSFTTIDYVSKPWSRYTSPDNTFSTWAPIQFNYKGKLTGNDGDPMSKYESYDSSRGDNYEVVVQEFSKYYWQNNDSALWDQLTKRYAIKDSLVLKKPIVNGGVKGYELLLRQKGSFNIKRVAVFLNDGMLYTLATVQLAAEINNENNNRFFDSFKFSTVHADNNLLVSKAALLLSDISSLDSEVSSKALAYLSLAPFTKKDVPLLHEALTKHYSDVQDHYPGQTRNKLKVIIIGLNDSSSFSFAKNNYAVSDDTTRNILLAIMASFHTQENYNDLQTLLLKQPPRLQPDYNFIDPMSDSLKLTASILPGLLPLLKDTVMAPALISLSNKLLDSGLIKENILQPYQGDILNFSHKELAAFKADSEYYKYSDYQLIQLIGKMDNAECNSALQQWSLVSQSYMSLRAVNLLLLNKQDINPKAIQALAKNKETRIDLYDSLKAYYRTNLFPAAYFSQQSFGESYVYAAAEDDDPSAVSYLSQKVINFKGRQSRIYFYKLTFGDEDDSTYSIACAGPFSLDLKDVASGDARGEIYYDEDFDKSKVQEQEAALIKQMEKWFQWQDEKDER